MKAVVEGQQQVPIHPRQAYASLCLQQQQRLQQPLKERQDGRKAVQA